LQETFPQADNPDLLVGLGSPDDAAVYRLDDERALVVTTDFFTPIVDDPYAYGAIAAANALSDVYAMGGEPLLALNIAALPTDLPPGIAAEIFRGLAEKVRQAGAVIAGGHSIQDKEPKVGLAVVGMVHPQQLLTKSGAVPGDRLLLTKPLGSGCITTAAKRDKVEATHLQAAIEWMSRLNRAGGKAATAAGARALTDVTGFGLIGHASEMTVAGDVTLHFKFDRIPLFDGVRQLADRNIFPGGSAKNRVAYEQHVEFAEDLTEPDRMLLFDAQTSGGLLVSLPAEKLDTFAAEMDRQGEPWWEVGVVGPREDVDIKVTR
jgi:selenide,water dikinase